jgi:flavin reductase (DIM6/NTAB) family NADH-FMN oxidoreductase RutF
LALNTKDFRRALGRFATGVCVVSAQGPKGPLGITINSFTSVSLDPALVLWCLDKRSLRFDVFSSLNEFSINILGAHQVEVARLFAGLEDRPVEPFFDGDRPPFIKQSPVIFQCRHQNRFEGGDHIILVGEVMAIKSDSADPSIKALTYYQGQFGEI